MSNTLVPIYTDTEIDIPELTASLQAYCDQIGALSPASLVLDKSTIETQRRQLLDELHKIQPLRRQLIITEMTILSRLYEISPDSLTRLEQRAAQFFYEHNIEELADQYTSMTSAVALYQKANAEQRIAEYQQTARMNGPVISQSPNGDSVNSYDLAYSTVLNVIDQYIEEGKPFTFDDVVDQVVELDSPVNMDEKATRDGYRLFFQDTVRRAGGVGAFIHTNDGNVRRTSLPACFTVPTDDGLWTRVPLKVATVATLKSYYQVLKTNCNRANARLVIVGEYLDELSDAGLDDDCLIYPELRMSLLKEPDLDDEIDNQTDEREWAA